MAYVVGAAAGGYRFLANLIGWERQKRWQAVLHLFDADGNHKRTDVRLGGYEIDDAATVRAFQHLHAIADELTVGGEPDYGDIGVRPFSVTVDGIFFGLVYEHRKDEDEEYEFVMFWPRDIMFHPPWDSGCYST